jgi:hypothetical protein
MKKQLSIILLVLAPVLSGCGSTEHLVQTTTIPAGPLPHSMKGYELYSWSVEGKWYYTLMTGTNRSKSYAEITSDESTFTPDGWAKFTVQGADAIKVVLGRLPPGEEILWIGEESAEQIRGGAGNLAFPGQTVIDDIERYCRRLGLDLQVVR